MKLFKVLRSQGATEAEKRRSQEPLKPRSQEATEAKKPRATKPLKPRSQEATEAEKPRSHLSREARDQRTRDQDKDKGTKAPGTRGPGDQRTRGPEDQGSQTRAEPNLAKKNMAHMTNYLNPQHGYSPFCLLVGNALDASLSRNKTQYYYSLQVIPAILRSDCPFLGTLNTRVHPKLGTQKSDHNVDSP